MTTIGLGRARAALVAAFTLSKAVFGRECIVNTTTFSLDPHLPARFVR
jgi:hypothetical protein